MRFVPHRILPVCQPYGKHLPFGNIADTAGFGHYAKLCIMANSCHLDPIHK